MEREGTNEKAHIRRDLFCHDLDRDFSANDAHSGTGLAIGDADVRRGSCVGDLGKRKEKKEEKKEEIWQKGDKAGRNDSVTVVLCEPKEEE